MKFYRYLIYKLYTWGKGSGTPIGKVIITLTVVHFFQLELLYMIVLKLFPELGNIFLIAKQTEILVFVGIFFILNYLIFYNKKRWERYVNEFKNESENERKRGKFYVLLYLIGTFVIFFLSLPILYGF